MADKQTTQAEIYHFLCEYYNYILSFKLVLKDEPNDLETLNLLKDAEVILDFWTKTDPSNIVNACGYIKSSNSYGKILGITQYDSENKKIESVDVEIFQEIDDENRVANIKFSDIKLRKTIDETLLKKTNKLECLFEEDGMWYLCEIIDVNKDLVKINYIDYNTVEEVRRDRLRIVTKTSENNMDESEEKIMTHNGYIIPKSVIVRPGDSAEVKEQKRNKLSKIKYEQKKMKRNEEIQSRVQSWKEHKKNIKKNTNNNKKYSLDEIKLSFIMI
uniref:Uncharacterized protein LOC113796702 n=1 Tax=Dermatophagoides pteronyssinus TaxID=6956 RepID=A0A6P6YD25_DERPT|nr:uncharacterized protein LOC113796702 [Dermatophagoides pteronyssinus]